MNNEFQFVLSELLGGVKRKVALERQLRQAMRAVKEQNLDPIAMKHEMRMLDSYEMELLSLYDLTRETKEKLQGILYNAT